MRIAVCLKQVPDTAQVRTDPVTHTLCRAQAGRMLNPFDLYAVEEAVRLQERGSVPSASAEFANEVRTIALSMGPQSAREALRQALALGIDAAALLCDRAFAGSDTWATSRVLAQAVRHCGAELVLCGKQASDGDTAQVGPELAGQLDWPVATYVSAIREIRSGHGGGYAVVERLLDDGRETLRIELPAVLTVVKEINPPRLPTLPGVLRALAAKIAVWDAQTLGLEEAQIGLSGSPTRVRKIFAPQARRAVTLLSLDDLSGSCATVLSLIRKH